MSKRQIKPSTEMSSFGILFTSYLSKHRLSVADFSRRSGIPETTIHNWNKGSYFPTMGNIIVIAELLSRLECCFGDTMIMEISRTHPNYINMIRRENNRQSNEGESPTTSGGGV